jgi:5'-nucleotidase
VTRPLILVTNDDGVLAPGLATLVDAIADLGEVLVCAPETERSGSGHAISFHTHLRAHAVRPGWWSLSGTPVDCVYFAMMHLCPHPPTVVCSGINHGYNLGSDVLYSGTVGGAAEAHLRGTHALAVSAAVGPHGAAWAAPVVREVVRAMLLRPPAMLINLNVPPLPDHVDAPTPELAAAPRAMSVTRLGVRRYRDGVEPRTDPMGRAYYWIGGPPEPGSSDLEHDTGAVAAGIVSLTPLQLDLTAPDLSGAQRLLASIGAAASRGEPHAQASAGSTAATPTGAP